MEELKRIHVAMFSSGAGSAWVAKYLLDKYGPENTVFLMTDTLWEDEDNYRFMKEVEDHLKHPITFHNDPKARTPRDIFIEKKKFGTFYTAPCSKILKMDMTMDFVQERIQAGELPVLYFGIDYSEARRAPRIAYNYKHNVDIFEDGVECRFPLIGEINGVAVSGEDLLFGTDYFTAEKLPVITNKLAHDCLDKQEFVISTAEPKKEIQEEWGIKLPRMYELGFSHANCAGRCVKAGLGHYRTLYRVWPERFKEMEDLEREINAVQVAEERAVWTLLKKDQLQPDGTKKTLGYSLERYRTEVLQYENQMSIDDFLDDSNETPCECVF